MGFWDTKLGRGPQAAPAAPQQPAQAPGAMMPWWMPAGNPQAAQRPTAAPSVTPEGAGLSDYLHQEGYHTTRAQSTNQQSHCPDCGSRSFMTPMGHPNVAPRCLDCGYNPLFIHSTHGVTSTTQAAGPPRESRGQHNTPVGALPMGSVVGHV